MIRWLLDLLYPPRCVLCHGFLPSSRQPVCDACAMKLLGREPRVRQGRYFSRCIAPFSYEEPVRASIHRYKFRGCRFYADFYAGAMAACLRQEADFDAQLITWVPISKKRKKQRGYDQARLLALALAERLQLPAAPCLVKIRDNPAQSGLRDRDERKKNVSGAYVPSPEGSFSGKRILLVDDVITTGSTLEECSRILRKNGAESVVCAAAAMTN